MGQESLFTARKRSLGQGNVFTPVCLSVHIGEGSWLPSIHWEGEGGLYPGGGGSSFRGKGDLHSGGGQSASMGRGVCIQGGVRGSVSGGIGQTPQDTRDIMGYGE